MLPLTPPRHGRALLALVMLAALAGAAGAQAASPRSVPTSFAIELTADGVPAWQRDAIAASLAADVPDAQLRAAEATAADLLMHAQLGPGRLRYQIRLGEHPAVLGEIALAGVDRRGLAQAVRAVLADASVLRDAPARADEPARLANPAVDGGGLLALLAVALFLLSPLLVGALRWRIAPRRLLRLRASRRTIATLIALLALGYALAVHGERVAGAAWLFLLAGGLAWGGFAAVTLPQLLPPLPGLDRVEHDELGRVLRAWALLAGQRVVMLALFYAPFAIALALASDALALPPLIALALAAPLAGFAVRHWIHSWVELLALRLDEALVDGEASAANPWHAAVRGYFLGYLRRSGWPVGDHLLDGILFLPGSGDAVALYGGGLGHARVVIPRPWLELALAPYGRPHDYAAPRISTLEWDEWNAGLVLPTEVGAAVANREQRQPRGVRAADAQGAPDVDDAGGTHQPFGEPPTLAGLVEPDALDLRSAHRPTEDPLWLDWDAGEVHDGTDAGDKDFLFGVLVHELGRIQRHEDRAATLALAARGRSWARLESLRPVAFLRRLLQRQSTQVAAAHVALNGARHHRIQLLAWRAGGDERILSSRAHPPELARRAAELLPRLDPAQARLLSAPPPASALGRRRVLGTPRRLALAAVAAAAVAALAVAVARAIAYHPLYAQRLELTDDRERPTDHGEAP